MQNEQNRCLDFVNNECVRQKQTFFKKVLTKGKESGRIIKLSRKRQRKISQKAGQKNFKEILKKYLTRRKECDIITRLAQKRAIET